MGISHHGELPCVPSNGGGSWKTSGTLDSLSYLWQQQGFGTGSLWLPWPGHLQASPPCKEELTPAAWPISRLSSSPQLHPQQGKAPVAQELELVHQICIWLPWVWQADPQPCLHSRVQQVCHPWCHCDGPPSTWTPSSLNTPALTSITSYQPRLKIQQVNHSLNHSYIAGRKCHSFMHSFSHSCRTINAMQDMVIHLYVFSHSFIDIRQKLSLIHQVIHMFTHMYQWHWSGSWHCKWWWHQSSPSPCCARSCTLEESSCSALWSSLTTYKRWHAILSHHPRNPSRATSNSIAWMTKGDSNPYQDPPTPQCHRVTLRQGTYCCKSTVGGLQCSWPPSS